MSALHAESIFVPGRACSVFSNSPTTQLGTLEESPWKPGTCGYPNPMRLQCAFPDVETAKKWEPAWVCTGGLNHQPYRPWSQHKGIAASASWPRPGKHRVPCSLALPPGNTSSAPAWMMLFGLHP